jgi:predicted  nucleic acid-binding Zn-ribbon protein
MDGSAALMMPTAALPETDEARLLFYAEVLMANVPTLLADLNSAKYTFLSFSGKTREEVKQKQSLIQSLGRSFTSVAGVLKAVQNAKKTLEEYETKLVKAAPPKFVTSEEALRVSSSNDGNTNEGNMQTTDRSGCSKGGLSDNMMILSADDIKPVRAAEEELEKESAALAEVSQACKDMEEAFGKAKAQCQSMTEHVQSLKWKYEAVFKAWKGAAWERQVVAVMRDELKERRALMVKAIQGRKVIEEKCGEQELRIIQDSITKAEAESTAMAQELKAQKERYEVELATYQIAYKEQQAEVESLREQCKALQVHQLDLEMLAKKQQLEETDRNSLRKLMMQTLTLTPSKRGIAAERALTAEQQAEVIADHPLVSLLAARISVLQEQRKTIGGILVTARGLGKSDDVSNAVERIQALLEPAVQLDGDALAS